MIPGSVRTAPIRFLAEPPALTAASVTAQLIPAPYREPPYDDERTGQPPVAASVAELPFDEPLASRPCREVDFFDPQPTPRRHLPDPRPWAWQLIQAVFETLAGRRPAHQLQRWTTSSVFAALVLHHTERSRQIAKGMPVAIRSIHVGEPVDGVAEVCAVVRRGNRHHAVAARLEGLDGRWRCVAL